MVTKNHSFKKRLLGFLIFFVFGCGNDLSSDQLNNYERAEEIFSYPSTADIRPADNLSGLWEHKFGEDSTLRFLIKQNNSKSLTIVMAKKCIYSDVVLYSSVKFNSSINGRRFVSKVDVSDTYVNGEFRCSTSSSNLSIQSFSQSFDLKVFNQLSLFGIRDSDPIVLTKIIY